MKRGPPYLLLGVLLAGLVGLAFGCSPESGGHEGEVTGSVGGSFAEKETYREAILEFR